MPTTTQNIDARTELARVERAIEREWLALGQAYDSAEPALRPEIRRRADRLLGDLYEVGLKLSII